VDGLTIQLPSIGFSVDFNTGRIVYSDQVTLNQIPHLKSLSSENVGNIKIATQADTQEIERVIYGVTYVALSRNGYEASTAFGMMIDSIVEKREDEEDKRDRARGIAIPADKKDPPRSLLWISKEPAAERTLLLYTRPNDNHFNLYKLVRTGEGSYAVKTDDRSVGTFDMKGLQPLRRFCALADITANINQSGTHLSSISIRGFNLEFKVECVGNEHLAFNENVFPEFYIAPQQDHPAFRPFGAYLLLRNLKGKYKVLVSTQNPVTPALWCVYKHFQPFTHLLPSRIEMGKLKDAHYYSYDADEKGNFQSEDPEALIYLLRINMIHQNISAIESTLGQILTIAKRTPIPLKMWEQLILLTLLPEAVETSKKVRICLFAAMEENLLLHHTDPYEAGVKDGLYMFYRLLLIRALISDLESLRTMSSLEKKIEGQGAYSLDKEWYLYKCLLRQFDKVLEARSYIRLFKNREYLDAFIELTVLPIGLAARYMVLKEHFGIPETLFLRVLRATKMTYKNMGINTTVQLNVHQLVYTIFNKYFGHYVNQMQEVLDSVTSYFNIEKELVRIAQKVTLQPISESTLLEMRKLNQCDPDQIEESIFDASAATPERIIRRFPYYYAVARSERSPKEAKALYKMLLLIHNIFDGETNLLLGLLMHQYSYRGVYPTSQKLISVRRSYCFGHINLLE